MSAGPARPWRRAVSLVCCMLAGCIGTLALADCPTANTGATCGGALQSGTGGARRIPAPPTSAPLYQVGEFLPPGRYSRLLNTEYYGLRPVDGFWRYYEVEGRVFRVRPDTLEILEDATEEANAAF